MDATRSHPPSSHVLRDGTEITLREVEPDDKDALASGFDRMSPTSRYRRFFAPKDKLTDADLRYLTEVDHRDHEAVVGMGPNDEPVGVARYVRVGDERAEVAVAVVDDWQNLGAGTALLGRLTERARENGIKQFVALIMQDNAEAKDLFRSVIGDERHTALIPGGHIEMVIDIPEKPDRDSALARALRGAATGGIAINPWRMLRNRIAALQSEGASDESGENRPPR